MEQQEAPWQYKLLSLLLEKAGQKEGGDERPFSFFKFLSQPPKNWYNEKKWSNYLGEAHCLLATVLIHNPTVQIYNNIS